MKSFCFGTSFLRAQHIDRKPVLPVDRRNHCPLHLPNCFLTGTIYLYYYCLEGVAILCFLCFAHVIGFVHIDFSGRGMAGGELSSGLQMEARTRRRFPLAVSNKLV